MYRSKGNNNKIWISEKYGVRDFFQIDLADDRPDISGFSDQGIFFGIPKSRGFFESFVAVNFQARLLTFKPV
jgi:hypothetical protein